MSERNALAGQVADDGRWRALAAVARQEHDGGTLLRIGGELERDVKIHDHEVEVVLTPA